MEVINTCRQLVGVVGTGLYHSMANVQSTVHFVGIVVCSVSSDTIFTPIFCPFLTQLHHFPYIPLSPYVYLSYVPLLLCLIHAHEQMTRKHSIEQLVANNSIYWTTNIPKQSCSSS